MVVDRVIGVSYPLRADRVMGYGLDCTDARKTRQLQKCVQWITLESWWQRVTLWLA